MDTVESLRAAADDLRHNAEQDRKQLRDCYDTINRLHAEHAQERGSLLEELDASRATNASWSNEAALLAAALRDIKDEQSDYSGEACAAVAHKALRRFEGCEVDEEPPMVKEDFQ